MKKNIPRILLLFFIPWIGFSQTNKEVSAETLIQELKFVEFMSSNK
jgi:hypothetical protein